MSRITDRIFDLKIEGYSAEGAGVSSFDGKIYHVWNALENETVKARLLKKKKSHRICEAVEIVSAHPDRINSVEDHFICCSPWQILPQEKENALKLNLIKDLFRAHGVADQFIDDLSMDSPNRETYAYRNKMEYSFWAENDLLHPAFFLRGTRIKKMIKPCALADPAINESLSFILNEISTIKDMDLLAFKAMMLRKDSRGKVLAGLFTKRENALPALSKLTDTLCGFQVHLSNPKSPASISDQLLSCVGDTHLESSILGKKFRFGILSFFQIQESIFERVLTQIKTFVEKDEKIIDLFCGVGTIGLNIASSYQPLTLVDNNAENIFFAKENCAINDAHHARCICEHAEKISDVIESGCTLILDPPRSGVHEDVLKRIRIARPKKIIYLSCNPKTQVRDLALISDLYNIQFLKLYNFFPRTPHVESLCLLTLST